MSKKIEKTNITVTLISYAVLLMFGLFVGYSIGSYELKNKLAEAAFTSRHETLCEYRGGLSIRTTEGNLRCAKIADPLSKNHVEDNTLFGNTFYVTEGTYGLSEQ